MLRDSAPVASKIPIAKGRAYMRAQPLDHVLTSRLQTATQTPTPIPTTSKPDILTCCPKAATQISPNPPQISSPATLKLPFRYPHPPPISSTPVLKLPSKYPHAPQISSPLALKLPPRYPGPPQISSPSAHTNILTQPRYRHLPP